VEVVESDRDEQERRPPDRPDPDEQPPIEECELLAVAASIDMTSAVRLLGLQVTERETRRATGKMGRWLPAALIIRLPRALSRRSGRC
jgi:hypothetical protein